jgi:hypothetical protein
MNKEQPSGAPPMLSEQEAADHAVPSWLADVLNSYEAETAALRKKLVITCAQLAQANARAAVSGQSKPVEALPMPEDDYETRDDGQRVRKDRWKTGIQNIVTILKGSRSGFEIDEVVEMVRKLAEFSRADYESGGNGMAMSVPLDRQTIEQVVFLAWAQNENGSTDYLAPFKQSCWVGWQARAKIGPPALPPGWKAVPMELTDDMLAAGRTKLSHQGLLAVWEALMDASPEPPTPTAPSLLAPQVTS